MNSGTFKSGNKHPNFGKHLSDEIKRKISIVKKGKPNLFLKGKQLTTEHKEKISKTKIGIPLSETHRLKVIENVRRGENHPFWKNGLSIHKIISYRAIHGWVNHYRGKAIKCEHCGKEGNGRQIHWANIDHKYRRNLDDYIALCAKCHGEYDVNNNLRKITKKKL